MISFICTVYNEEATIKNLLESLLSQTKLPDEIVITDAYSSDETASIASKILDKSKVKFQIIKIKGNRSIGRNEAIRRAEGNIMVISDAGCVLHKNWLKNITNPFKEKSVDVVAGYYKGSPKTNFEKALVPYVLVMEDRLDPNNFLPATRSMAVKKRVWEKIGGFEEKYSHNEDYDFSKKLKERGFKIRFAKNALVFWTPRGNLKEAFVMFYRFAFGDGEAGIFRPKVVLVFLRYLIGVAFLWISILTGSALMHLITLLSVVLYCIWSVNKNYKYVGDMSAFVILPILQFASDLSILSGTSLGLIKRRF